MDLLIAEPLETEVLQWLEARQEVYYAPRITEDKRVFADALTRARAVMLPPHVPVNLKVLARAPRLRAIGRVVGGPENIDLHTCTRMGVEVVRCLDATAPAEAEFMLGALLTLLRPSPRDIGRIAGRELGHCTVGLVGMGASSRRLAKLLQALGSHVIGYDPALHASDPQWRRWAVAPVSLREIFAQADAVAVQLPYYTRYAGLLGERILPHGKTGQVLVSITPVEMFDEEVLLAQLNSGKLAAAWIDSSTAGALDTGHPLRQSRNLLTTARLAAYTREARLRSAWGVARRLHQVLHRNTPTLYTPTARPAQAPSGPTVVLRDWVNPGAAAGSSASSASR